MTDESQQESERNDTPRAKAPPAAEDVGEETAPPGGPEAGETLEQLEIERIDNTDPKVLFGSGSTLVLRSSVTGGGYILTHEQIEAACNEIELADDAGAADELEHQETELADDAPLNAAGRICAQLNRIADALGADAIPFDRDSDFNDVDRVEFRLMDIAGALERLDLAAIPKTTESSETS